MMSVTAEKLIFSGSMWKYPRPTLPASHSVSSSRCSSLFGGSRDFHFWSAITVSGMMIGALHAPVGDQLVGLGASDDAVLDQVVQHLGQAQFAVGRGFGGGLHGAIAAFAGSNCMLMPGIRVAAI